MPAEAYAGYGTALRMAVAVPLAEYDRQTLTAYIADLFRKEYSDVERDLQTVAQVIGRRSR